MPRRRLSTRRACSSHDLGHAGFREVALRLDLLVLDVDQHALDDVADLLHVDREADDVGPAPAFFLAQRLARDLGQVVLDGRVQLVDRVVELAQFCGQAQVVVLDDVEHADAAWSRPRRPGAAPRARRSRWPATAWPAPTGPGGAAARADDAARRLRQQRSTQRATSSVRPMKPMPTTTLNARWNSTTSCAGVGQRRAARGAATGRRRAPPAPRPSSLKTRLPSGTCRTSTADLAVVSTASRPLPRLAPSTRPSATSSGTTPELASVAISSTTARLE